MASSNKDSMKNVMIVALSVCLVAAVIVSGSAISLKPARLANKELDRNKNILIAAGLFKKDETPVSEIPDLFKQFEIAMVDLENNKLLTDAEVEALGLNIAKFDQRKAAKNESLSDALTKQDDVASIARRARYSVVYLLKENNKIKTLVLPIHGYGLWSVLYGFVALEGDLNTVSGITFYEHAETAGLGGEVDNPRWKALWVDKKIYASAGGMPSADVALTIVKGNVDPNAAGAEHQVDALSGATLTSKGVENLIGFWLGENGFGPLLKKLRG